MIPNPAIKVQSAVLISRQIEAKHEGHCKNLKLRSETSKKVHVDHHLSVTIRIIQ